MSVYNVPLEMRQRRQWMVASAEKRPMRWAPEYGDDKLVYGEKDNPNHWMTFEQALELGGSQGLRIGYCNTDDDGLSIIDLDNIGNANPDKKARDAETLAIQEYIIDQAVENGWYIETSQSGFGAHIVVQGKLSRDTNCGGIEFYGHGGFVVMTGMHARGSLLPMNSFHVSSFEELIGQRGAPDTAIQYSDEFMARLNAPFSDMERQEYMDRWQKLFKFNKRYIELEAGTDVDDFGNQRDGRGNEVDLDFMQGIYASLKGWPERHLVALRMFISSDRWFKRRVKKNVPYLLKETFPKAVGVVDADETRAREQKDSWKSAVDGFKTAAPAITTVSTPPVNGMPPMPQKFDVAPPMQFVFRKASEVEQDAPIEWAIKNVFPKRGIAAIYGWSAVGKSFLTLDMMMHIAEGKPWFGHKTRAMPVSYLALEGGDGMRNRLRAYRIGHGGHLPEIDIYKGKFDLSNGDQCAALINARKAANVLGGVIVIDTFSKAIGGSEENSNSDMKMVLEKAEWIAEQLDSLVVIVHHSTKPDAKTGIAGGARGAGAIIANTDATIQVVLKPAEIDPETGEINGHEERYWTTGGANAKVKEGARTDNQNFVLHVQKLDDPDEDGEDRTSCWIDAGGADVANSSMPPVMDRSKPTYSPSERASGKATRPRSEAPISNSQQELLQRAALEEGVKSQSQGKAGAPPGSYCAPMDAVLDRAADLKKGPDRAQDRRNLKTALVKMMDRKQIGWGVDEHEIRWVWKLE